MSAQRTLVLLRHAKAEPQGELADSLRPLAARGRRQATALGPVLTSAVGPVDAALVSSALRTTETYQLLAQGVRVRRHEVLEELYHAGPRDLLGHLQALDPQVRTALVVGHEPTISHLAALLHDARDDLGAQVSLGIPTATACVLRVPTPWSGLDRSTAHLVRLLRPEH